MSSTANSRVRVVAETANGQVVAAVELPATPERVFRALASTEVTNWWVRPGVFDTTEWTGEVRVGGRWQASGTFRGRPYTLEGEVLVADPYRELVHTWHAVGSPATAQTVAYHLEPVDGGTRVTLRHSGFSSPEACTQTAIGWETSFGRLTELLTGETP